MIITILVSIALLWINWQGLIALYEYYKYTSNYYKNWTERIVLIIINFSAIFFMIFVVDLLGFLIIYET